MNRCPVGKTRITLESGASRLEDILKCVRPELDRVEGHLRAWAESPNPLIADICRHLFRKNGKRLRPAILVLSEKLSPGPSDNGDGAFLGSLIEIIHTASLVHDDIIDDAPIRRGGESVHVRWGLDSAVLLGDYLFIKSLGRSVDGGDIRIIKLLTDLAGSMVEGELMDRAHGRNPELTESRYMDIIGLKTAALFSAAARLGAIVGQAPPDVEERLSIVGRHIGLAYQITDDILDFTGDEQRLGKPVFSDFRKGRVTLPVIHASGGCDGSGPSLDMIPVPGCPSGDAARILGEIRRRGSLDYALRKAEEQASRANELLGLFPPSPCREALCRLTRFIVDRAR
jgi:octaprenyl-diphosphate synthase